MDRKLTPLQMETLRLARNGKLKEHRFGYGAWRIVGGNPGTVGKLRTWGLLTRVQVGPDDYRFDLADVGAAYLSEDQT